MSIYGVNPKTLDGMVIRLAWGIWIASLILTAVGSLYPQPETQSLSMHDKVIHFGVYAFLAFIPVWKFHGKAFAIRCSLWMIGLGILLEFGQLLVPGRSFSFLDMLANTLGVCVGLAIGLSFRSRVGGWKIGNDGSR